MVRPASILSIAGSDCGGGAGVQADIKTISANGGYALAVITAITAQNTQGVYNIFPVSPDLIEDQLCAVFEDFKIDAVKIGMLHNSKTVEVVSNVLKKYQPKFVVLDPVMISSSGNVLTSFNAISVIIEKLLPFCTLITPNINEMLSLISAGDSQFNLNVTFECHEQSDGFFESIKASALKLYKLGVKNILITGVFNSKYTSSRLKNGSEKNHNLFDILLHNNKFSFFGKEKIITNNTHGTGCSLSSSIATNLALGEDMIISVGLAQNYVHECIKSASNMKFGQGKGPINHFFSPHALKILN